MAGFQRNAAPKQNAGGKRSMKYGGVPSAGNRAPYPHEGKYRVRVKGGREGDNGKLRFVCADLEVITYEPAPAAQRTARGEPMHAIGDIVGYSQFYTGNCQSTGEPRLKLFTRACIGYDNDKDFGEFCEQHAREFVVDGDPTDWALVAELHGEFPELTAKGVSVIGRIVDMVVTRGKEFTNESGDTDFYRNYAWSVVPDDEQDNAN